MHMDLISLALPFIAFGLAVWAYARREAGVDQRLGFRRHDGLAETEAMPQAPVRATLRHVPGVALMVATLVLMEKSAGFARLALALGLAWFAVVGFKSRVWPYRKRGANSKEVRDLTLLFAVAVCGLAVIFWRALAGQVN